MTAPMKEVGNVTAGQYVAFDKCLEQAWQAMLSDTDKAFKLLDHARTLVDSSVRRECQLFFHEGWAYIFQGDHLQALKQLTESLALAEQIKDPEEFWRIHNGMGMAYQGMGQYGEALHHYRQSLAISQSVVNINGIFASQLNLAALHYEIDDLVSVEELLNQMLGLDSAAITAENLGEAALLQAHLHSRRSRFQDALLGCRAALEYARQLNFGHLEIQALIAVARCQRLQNRLVEAETTLLVTIDHPEFDKEGVTGLYAYIELAKVLASTGHFSRAVRTLRQGLRREALPEFSLIQQRALETLAVCLERAKKYRAAHIVLRLTLDLERKLQQRDVRRQIELRQYEAKMEDERLARQLAQHENRQLKAAQSRLQLINELARQLASSLRIEDIGQKLYDIVKERLDVHFVSLALNRPDVEAIEYVMAIDDGTRLPGFSIPYSFQQSRAVQAIRSGTPLLISGENQQLRSLRVGDNRMLPLSQLFVPLIHNQSVIGMVSLQSSIAERFGDDELELLSSLAPFIAITLSNALSHQQLFEVNTALSHEKTQIEAAQQRIEYMANHDTLTGLPNRRLLVDFVDERIAVANETGRTFYLVYIDLDGFKPVNDRHGHRVGDSVLTTLANRLSDALRKADFAARVGGDEFVIIVDDFDNEPAIHAFISRMLSVIEKPVISENEEVTVSASIGVARYGTHGRDLDTLMHHADQAMYGIKRSGKGGIAYAELHPRLLF
ncbi:diguanylate cyclase [Saccharospirillum sp.]|uniref:diguanylate cyclase domain-containing protein n=1 Tax=Saccharospirillum sp. TaxID=2033801 RepID=UPI0034A01A09